MKAAGNHLAGDHGPRCNLAPNGYITEKRQASKILSLDQIAQLHEQIYRMHLGRDSNRSNQTNHSNLTIFDE